MSLMVSDDDDELIRDHRVTGGSGADDHATERTRLLGGPSETEDEDFFLNGPKMGSPLAAKPHQSGGKLDGLQRQLHDVTEVMRDNVNRIMERGDRLDELQMRSAQLDGSANEFRISAERTRRKMWWQNTKMKAVIGVTTSFVIVIIIIIASW